MVVLGVSVVSMLKFCLKHYTMKSRDNFLPFCVKLCHRRDSRYQGSEKFWLAYLPAWFSKLSICNHDRMASYAYFFWTIF